jgi:hypothetical protein
MQGRTKRRTLDQKTWGILACNLGSKAEFRFHPCATVQSHMERLDAGYKNGESLTAALCDVGDRLSKVSLSGLETLRAVPLRNLPVVSGASLVVSLLLVCRFGPGVDG